MRRENQSSMSMFLFLRLPIQAEKQGMFFVLLLGMNLTTVLGNLLIILLIRLEPRLHILIYSFLITWPSQIVMACDRYVTTYQTLHYTYVMKQELCVSPVAVSWFLCCIHALLHTLLLVQPPFCADNVILHFFCDLTVFLKLSCSDTSLNLLVIFTVAGVLFIPPLSSIMGWYIHTGTTVLRSPTPRDTLTFVPPVAPFSLWCLHTMGHLLVFTFSPHHGTPMTNIIVSVVYAIVSPMPNPFISSLQNRNIKHALEIFVNRANILN
ncbi:olfactory receptor 1J4-like [Phacochoerus africanus]|uniref:olfactory receptor 1J4-like n=1 Tax=Phacochoerus africanus TaxID=41426 RepID=UPI001FD9458D|nr:olfactory receptor 1J4-like [Phacochoerus africanus]